MAGLSFLPRRTPMIMQTEAAECGLACLAMVAAHHGQRHDIATLRREHGMSLRGAQLKVLVDVARALELAARPLRVEPAALGQLRLPAIAHFDFNHFVVITRVGRSGVEVNDPARGVRRLSHAEFSRHFTGVALELTPTPAFERGDHRHPVGVLALLGSLRALSPNLLRIALLSLAFEVLALSLPWLTQLTVDEVLVSADRDLATVLALGFGLVVLAATAIFALRGWLVLHLSTQLSLAVLTRLFAHLLRLPLAFFEKRHIGDLLSRFASMDAIQRTLTAGSVEVLIDGVLAAALVVVMALYSPMLTAVVLATVALYALLRLGLYRTQRDALNEQLVFAAQQQTHFIETLRAMPTVKMHSGEAERLTRWQNLLVDTLNAAIRGQSVSVIARTASWGLFALLSVLVVWLGARAVMAGGFSVGMLLAFLAWQALFATRVANLIDKFTEFRLLGLHAERVADIATESAEPVGKVPVPDLTRARWQVEGLGFRYGPHDPYVFRGLSLTVAPGEVLAITGPSGVGKSTFAKVLLGLLPPTEGQVRIDGIDVRDIDATTLRAQVAAVMQEDYVFAATIRDNVTFFESEADEGRIWEALRAAALAEDVEAMPMRLDSLVANAGSVLSGGQRQRLLLARAFYRRPKFVLLDEATSALDTERERSTAEAVLALGVTTVIIAHREQTIARADRVVRLGDQPP
jgi:ATP-binding cassette subfamily B protein RaxB